MSGRYESMLAYSCSYSNHSYTPDEKTEEQPTKSVICEIRLSFMSSIAIYRRSSLDPEVSCPHCAPHDSPYCNARLFCMSRPKTRPARQVPPFHKYTCPTRSSINRHALRDLAERMRRSIVVPCSPLTSLQLTCIGNLSCLNVWFKALVEVHHACYCRSNRNDQ